FHGLVFKSGDDLGIERICVGHCQQISENRSGIPKTVAVSAGTVLPGAAPKDAGHNKHSASMAEGVGSYAAGEVGAPITAPEAMQFQVRWQEMIEPVFHPFDLACNEIELDRIQSAR